VVSDALDCLGANRSSPISIRDGSRHVVARGRDEIDFPSVPDEVCEVAAVTVDPGCAGSRRVLVDAQESPGGAPAPRLARLFYGSVIVAQTGVRLAPAERLARRVLTISSYDF
jgi:hypothetical protein